MKSVVLVLLALLVISLVSIGIITKSSANWSQEEKATVIKQGVITPKQKEHSRLYQEYGRGLKSIPEQLASGMPGVLIKVGPPLQGMTRNPIPISLQEFLRKLACDSNAVVIGSVKDNTSQMTENEDFVFTDYQFIIEEVLKDYAAYHIIPQTEITVTRPGGKVQLEGKIVQAIDASFMPLNEGKHYLLFLNHIPTTGAYKAVNSFSSFEVDDKKVSTLTKETMQVDRETDDPTLFMNQVRASIASGCKDK